MPLTLVERLAVALRDLALLPTLDLTPRERASRKLDIAVELRAIAKLVEKESRTWTRRT